MSYQAKVSEFRTRYGSGLLTIEATSALETLALALDGDKDLRDRANPEILAEAERRFERFLTALQDALASV